MKDKIYYDYYFIILPAIATETNIAKSTVIKKSTYF